MMGRRNYESYPLLNRLFTSVFWSICGLQFSSLSRILGQKLAGFLLECHSPVLSVLLCQSSRHLSICSPSSKYLLTSLIWCCFLSCAFCVGLYLFDSFPITLVGFGEKSMHAMFNKNLRYLLYSWEGDSMYQGFTDYFMCQNNLLKNVKFLSGLRYTKIATLTWWLSST